MATNNSLLAGMSRDVLQAQLTALQTAYLELAAGSKVVTASYSQGDGAKSVTYRQADMAALTQAIRTVQAQLGLISQPRRALRFIHR
jgi:hypothetical protein